MSEKLGVAPCRSLSFLRAESLRIAGRQVRNSTRVIRLRLFAREFTLIFTSSELHWEIKLDSVVLTHSFYEENKLKL